MDIDLIALEKEVAGLTDKLGALKTEMSKVIIGQQEVIDQLLITFIAGGHALLEGVPGLAKTLMIRTLASVINLDFKRIQFTPDLMPSDIIGTEILEEDQATGKRSFNFKKGPIFSNIILADEINRTPPKTQAALLEAMQEFEVTYSGKTYPLQKPFFILATQNPIEQSGTFVLPEAQQDRFLMYLKVDYPSSAEERLLLKNTTGVANYELKKIITGQEIITLQSLVRQVPISDHLIERISDLVRNTRPQTTTNAYVKEWTQWGAGPRAGQALILTAKARALINGRFSVLPEDIEAVAKSVLRHRVLVNFKAEASNITSDHVIVELLKSW